MRFWTLLVACMMLAPLSSVTAQSSAGDIDGPAADVLQLRLQVARGQLDAAARELKELNREFYTFETHGARGKTPLLGVLIGRADDTDGISIQGLAPEGGAAAAGLVAGDKLIAVNGYRLDGGDEPLLALREAMSSVEPGDTVSVEYLRDGIVEIADITTQPRGVYLMHMAGDSDFTFDFDFNFDGLAQLEELRENFKIGELKYLRGLSPVVQFAVMTGGGLRLEEIDADLASYFGVESGVLVMSSTAEDSSFKAGDILLSVDGQTIETASDAYDLLFTGSTEMTAEVMRKGVQESITFDASDLAKSHSFRGHRVIRLKRGDGIEEDIDFTIEIEVEQDED